MDKGLIRLTYRKAFDAAVQLPADRLVWEETYREFFMQVQAFNPGNRYATFREVLAHDPAAERLHYLTSRAARGYLQQLDGRIPDVLNALGEPSLPFSQFRFEVLDAPIARPAAHRFAIFFHSEPLTWIGTIGDRLLLAPGDQRAALRAGQEIATDLIPLVPGLNLASYQTTPQS
jgi:hypothetical protein